MINEGKGIGTSLIDHIFTGFGGNIYPFWRNLRQETVTLVGTS